MKKERERKKREKKLILKLTYIAYSMTMLFALGYLIYCYWFLDGDCWFINDRSVMNDTNDDLSCLFYDRVVGLWVEWMTEWASEWVSAIDRASEIDLESEIGRESGIYRVS